METSKTLQNYLDELSSNSPTPGGGNVAALCGALASSLGIMVCNLTIGKKKYAEVENEMIIIKDNLLKYQSDFIELGKNDNLAFDKVMNAIKLPKESEEEKEIRNQEIEKATIGAAEVPSQVMQSAKEILPLLKTIIEKGNKNSISDAGVAVALTETASKGAYLNVLINCSSLNNQIIAQEIKKRADIMLEETLQECKSLTQKIIQTFNQ
ncbi:MAG: cyclodeaminase/cyclohydrolase family protein [Stygiobacter sp.]|uniref:Cyclodeaminase/cyclohydrolase family protein n=1 Tax=Stygiobacter electus TaxID=3032292 RepID=A0AAE3TCY8_9BACT|nr:cyclodeaminase/cyclohydrolase family protein [Stygiobacter electus]MDF1612420.1 cyclodeaminase/cyclohydrolase family protein [Stygiobacter electus]